jgi:predicted PolB exonuclease-like 3'-5' exonuclease
MSVLVFDIETVGVPWESLDEDTQEYLLKYANTEEEQEVQKEMVGFYPLTGEIVAIGLYDPEKNIQSVYFQAPNKQMEHHQVINDVHYIVGTEKEILEKFWATITKYTTFVTFNGRGFDCPYILMRSAVHRIAPRKELMPYRYDSSKHCDLQDQLTFYGATRKFNLDFYCKRFGITSPKSEGVTGHDVPQYFRDERYMEIAEYCMRDVVATAELFKVWNSFIRI